MDDYMRNPDNTTTHCSHWQSNRLPDPEKALFLSSPDTLQASLEADILPWFFWSQSSFRSADSYFLHCFFLYRKFYICKIFQEIFIWDHQIQWCFWPLSYYFLLWNIILFISMIGTLQNVSDICCFTFFIWFIRPGTTGIFISQSRYIFITSAEILSSFSHSIFCCCQTAVASPKAHISKDFCPFIFSYFFEWENFKKLRLNQFLFTCLVPLEQITGIYFFFHII